MKNLYLSLLILAFPFLLLAQSIHGIWSGTMVNDTLKVTQNFELGLTEYRGRITGYTYQTYIIRDTFYYSVKRIRAERKDGFLVVEDVDRIADNFPDKAARKVHMTVKYPLINDTTFDFTNGHWSTNQTKVYYSVGGDVRLKELEDEKESDLLAHLQEMDVKTDIAVRQNNKKPEEKAVATAKIKRPPQQNDQQQVPDAKKNNDVAKNSSPQPPVTKATSENENTKEPDKQSSITEDRKVEVVSATNTKENKQQIKSNLQTTHKPDMSAIDKKKEEPVATANTNLNKPASTPVLKNDVAANVGGVQASNGNIPVVNKSSQTQTVESKKPELVQVSQKKDQPVTSKPDEQKNINAVVVNKPSTQQKELAVPAKELPAAVAGRQNETIQDIYFKNDSLILSLYDNGIVDGDTVSVFMNGENIISKQKLKEAATKKTIYISSNSDSVQLVLFAENLGTIPPNTGLLTVRDGDDVYQVRFSADLQKNASIILHRKK
jgi:hypothetical protein